METNSRMRCVKWVLLPGLWLGACSDTVNNLGRVEATGGAHSLSGTGGGATAGNAGSGTCGGRVCPAGDICCGPPECGFCNTPGTNVYCPTSCGSGGSPGSAGNGGATACPPGLPASSAACSPEGLSCYYSGCPTYCGANASCSNGSWSVMYTNCICASSGGASSAGGGGGTAGAGGAGGASCTRFPTDDAHCSTMGYPPYAYFCVVPIPMPDPTCVIYNGIGSGDFFCCP